MGIIKAANASVGSVMADQWLEYYSCDSLPQGVLAVRAQKRVSERSANTKGEENVISDGSVICVNAGQCAIAIDKGQIIGCYDTPGENIYHSDSSPSIFRKGGLRGIVKKSFDRFGYGGVAADYQVIMVLDMREHFGNPFAFKAAINLTDRRTQLSFDASLTISGMFSFKIVKPAVFYAKICSNRTGTVRVADILPQITAELNALMRAAVSQSCTKGASAYDLSMSANDIADAAAAQISEQWIEERGFAVSSVGIDSISLTQGDKNLLQSVQMAKALTDPTLAAAVSTGAQAQAMQSAAKNIGPKEPIQIYFHGSEK